MSVMLNAYPDSCGGKLSCLVKMLQREEFRDAFSQLYILPSLFQSDLDRGFSVISYDINEDLADADALVALQNLNLELLLDFVLNHLSVQSPQFQDLLKNGDESEFKDFFIDWNEFWKGKGKLSSEGYIIPEEQYLSKLFMRKPGLPILKIPFPDGTARFYWNTFYQRVTETSDGVEFLGQMDLNGNSAKVWEFYDETFRKMEAYGAKIVRLDAFAYLHKEAGLSNFFNEPGTWDYLMRLKDLADKHGLTLLPEIHSKYEDLIHREISKRGFPIYDFFFPGLVFYTIETRQTAKLLEWIDEIIENNYRTINMLGCHDGIPVLDVKGLLDENQIEDLMTVIQNRGGRIKDLYGPDGKKIAYYQINSTFFSAFGEDENKLLLARAVQMFMPGTPLVWYLDLFAGTNDYEAADSIGHKDINRTNLTEADIDKRLELPVVRNQLKLLRFRNTSTAFSDTAELSVEADNEILTMCWNNSGTEARLTADLNACNFKIEHKEPAGEWIELLI
ncbi:MAG: alpha-amylase family glycosyl hydrolase [Spirochaetales bacterium]|uniref:Alpha-amylase family glycosyl hydrolase n=1 Tax=Candidatus Thalassospirochaeta sargassi TaxID=3119039 RepID=A0AAJ1IJ60_9SPIO|nr:alpha-amylase family glycosyl hydrolase [Spirochaetales bacterium]